jgi:ribonuclease BN (tRNA processing enzyme)
METSTQRTPLSFVGTGSAFNHTLGNNSAYLKRISTMVLIDCGGTVFHRIQTLNLLKDIKDLYVVITHMHPDHIGSLGDLIFYTYYMLQFKTTIIYPDLTSLTNLLYNMGVTKEFYDAQPAGKELMVNSLTENIKFEYIVQQHTNTLNSYGYIFTVDDIKVFYSGDSKSIPNLILERFQTGEINYLYQDTCSYDIPNIPHLPLNKLAQCIEPTLRHRVYCMHLDNSFDTVEAENLGFNIAKL